MDYSVREESFETVEEEWERILPQCPANTIFVTPWWQKTWWNHFGGDSEMRILSVRKGEEIVGIAPLMLNDKVLSFLGDTDLFDYHDFLVPAGNESAFYNTLCTYLDDMKGWTTIQLKSVLENSPALEYLPDLAKNKGYSSEIQQEDVAPIAVLPSTWDEYVASLNKKKPYRELPIALCYSFNQPGYELCQLH